MSAGTPKPGRTLPKELDRAPRPIKRLAALLDSRMTPLEVMPIKDAERGDRLLMARTIAGYVKVWKRRATWQIDLHPHGMTEFVDAGVWQACETKTRLKISVPSVRKQVEWLEGLLTAGRLPVFDRECIERLAQERKELPAAPSTRQRLLVSARYLTLFVLLVWAAARYDMVGLRVMASTTFATFMGFLVAPYAARYHYGRRKKKAQKRAERVADNAAAANSTDLRDSQTR